MDSNYFEYLQRLEGGLNIKSIYDLDATRARQVREDRLLVIENFELQEEQKLRKPYDPLTYLSG